MYGAHGSLPERARAHMPRWPVPQSEKRHQQLSGVVAKKLKGLIVSLGGGGEEKGEAKQELVEVDRRISSNGSEKACQPG